jgi:hypothetical protein
VPARLSDGTLNGKSRRDPPRQDLVAIAPIAAPVPRSSALRVICRLMLFLRRLKATASPSICLSFANGQMVNFGLIQERSAEMGLLRLFMATQPRLLRQAFVVVGIATHFLRRTRSGDRHVH